MLKLEKKRIIIFLLLTGLFLVPLSYLYYNNNDSNLLVALMFTPMLAMLITMKATNEKFNTISLSLNFKQNKKYYLFAYFIIPVICYLGAIIYFVLFPEKIDPLHSSYALKMNIVNIKDYVIHLLYIIPLALLLNPIAGILQCFGEEIAWRGYLLKKLLKFMSIRKAFLLNSIIWGLWHAPIIIAGFNYGERNSVLAVITMIMFCIVVGSICSYFYLKTKTIWISIIIHASLNAIDKYAPADLFMSDTPNYFIGPNIQGIIGCFGLVLLYFYILRKVNSITI